MGNSQVDLFKLFKQVSKILKKNQSALNKADTYNHDHGDHMVEIFDVITQAMKERKNADTADQLEYASQLLRQRSKSCSASLYTEGLSEASKQFTGKQIDIDTIIPLLQTLMGGGTAPAKPSTSGDLFGSLLTQMAGGESTQAEQGLDLGDLLGAGLLYMQAKQSDKSDMEALASALVGVSQMSSSPHRTQSAEIVTSTILNTLISLLSKQGNYQKARRIRQAED